MCETKTNPFPSLIPSGFLPVSAGNVRSEELIDVYRDNPQFKALRDTSRLKGKCGYCEFKEICGGSRARALAISGDVFAEEPLCAYQPKPKRGAEQPTEPALS